MITETMRRLIVASVLVVMAALGIEVSMPEAFVLHFPFGDIYVAEECSGVRSMMSLGIVACWLAIKKWRQPWHALCVLLCSPVFAFAANLLRIFVLIGISFYDYRFAFDTVHDYIGFFTFGLALFALFKTDDKLNTTNKVRKG